MYKQFKKMSQENQITIGLFERKKLPKGKSMEMELTKKKINKPKNYKEFIQILLKEFNTYNPTPKDLSIYSIDESGEKTQINGMYEDDDILNEEGYKVIYDKYEGTDKDDDLNIIKEEKNSEETKEKKRKKF